MMKHNWMKRVALLMLGLMAISAAMATEVPSTLSGVKIVTAEETQRMLDSGVPVIDTRVAAEYAEKTIKGAISVPYKEKSAKDPGFDASQDQFDLSKLPADKNAPMVLFCNSGECWKSYKACVTALKAGYKNIYWFRGGFPEWTGKGLPTQ